MQTTYTLIDIKRIKDFKYNELRKTIYRLLKVFTECAKQKILLPTDVYFQFLMIAFPSILTKKQLQKFDYLLENYKLVKTFNLMVHHV